MARKNQLVHRLVNGGSLAASFNSTPTLIKTLDNISYQINLTTTNSIGTFAVQGSNDYAVDEVTNIVTNQGSWTSLILAGGTPFVNAANDTILIDLNQLPFTAVRVAYTSSVAGTGTYSLYIVARQLGG